MHLMDIMNNRYIDMQYTIRNLFCYQIYYLVTYTLDLISIICLCMHKVHAPLA